MSFFQFGQKHFKYSQMFELLNLSSFILPILCPTPSYFSYYWQRMPVPLMCFFFLLKIIPFLHLHSFKKTSQVPFLQWGFPWYICPGPCDRSALLMWKALKSNDWYKNNIWLVFFFVLTYFEQGLVIVGLHLGYWYIKSS